MSFDPFTFCAQQLWGIVGTKAGIGLGQIEAIVRVVHEDAEALERVIHHLRQLSLASTKET